MTSLTLFSIFDNKAGTYGIPFAMVNRAVALRGFQQMANNPQSSIAQWPADHELYEVGAFDQITGELTRLDRPDYVGRASELVSSQVAS